MTNLQSKRKKSKFLVTARKNNFITGVVISALAIITPLLFYAYRYCPADLEVWETKYFTIGAGGFLTVQGFVYALAGKSILVMTLSMWFLTCKHWWRYALLVPFSVYLFQFVSVLNQQQERMDEFDYIQSLPITLPILIIHILAAKNINYFKGKLDLKDEIDAELENLINNE